MGSINDAVFAFGLVGLRRAYARVMPSFLGFRQGLDSAGSALFADKAEGEECESGEDDAAYYSAYYGANGGLLLGRWFGGRCWFGRGRGRWDGTRGSSSGEGGLFSEVDGEIRATPALARGFD